MSPGGKAEGMARLRRAVEGIEARSGPAQARAPSQLSLTRALDRALGGGLTGDGLHEIAPATPGDGAAAMGFALALAARFMAERSAAGLILAEDFARARRARSTGLGLSRMGLTSAGSSSCARPTRPPLLAMEEALKSGAPAVVVGEMWTFGNTISPSRAGCCSPPARGRARRCSCRRAPMARPGGYRARPRRVSRSPRRRARISSAGGGRGLPGPPAFAARLVKARLRFRQGPPRAASMRRGSSA